MLQKAIALMELHPWIMLAVIGAINDLVQRFPKIRAMSLFQLLPNMLKLTPLSKIPVFRSMIEMLDTPEPIKPMFPKDPPSA